MIMVSKTKNDFWPRKWHIMTYYGPEPLIDIIRFKEGEKQILFPSTHVILIVRYYYSTKVPPVVWCALERIGLANLSVMCSPNTKKGWYLNQNPKLGYK